MKAKHLLTALVVPALLAACADDEFATNTQNKVDVDGTLVELGEDFAIGLTRGDDATTRANWHYEAQVTFCIHGYLHLTLLQVLPLWKT